LRSTAVAAMLVATLAACAGSGSDGVKVTASPNDPLTTPLSADPANGSVISNDAFSYAVPEGWVESDQSRAISLAIDLADDDAFVDNLNVVTDTTFVGIEGTELEDAAEQILADASATHITAREPVQIDGEEAVHASAFFELGEPKYRIEQYAVAHDETGYIVTLSFSPDVPAAERDKISESILATWKWDS
jgi:hypothetical protein